MRGAGVVVIALASGLAACFSPSPATGLACAPPEGDCPSGQHCEAGICRADGDRPDGAPVADAPVIDAGIDARVIDAPPTDARPVDAIPPDARPDCPVDYASLPGVGNGHVYRAIDVATSWADQRDDCADDGFATYLAIPNTQPEFTALIAGAADAVWVGLTDGATEGNWKTVLGGTAPFLPWGPGQPDDFADNEDCGEGRGPAVGSEYDLNDLPCDFARPAFCECVPP